MTAPTAERLAAIRLGARTRSYVTPGARGAIVDLLAALDYVVERVEDIAECLRLGHAGSAMIEVDELLAYIGTPTPQVSAGAAEDVG